MYQLCSVIEHLPNKDNVYRCGMKRNLNITYALSFTVTLYRMCWCHLVTCWWSDLVQAMLMSPSTGIVYVTCDRCHWCHLWWCTRSPGCSRHAAVSGCRWCLLPIPYCWASSIKLHWYAATQDSFIFILMPKPNYTIQWTFSAFQYILFLLEINTCRATCKSVVLQPIPVKE